MGRPGLAAVWTGWLLAALVLAEDPVYIPDPALKAAIEDALGRVDPTAMDMLELDELTAPSRCISDLTGLQYATDLQWLDLSRGNDSGGAGIWDIGPLAGLTKLKHLDLNNNYIRDISALSGMDLLEFLDLHDNRVWDLSPLAGKTRLHTAYLYRQWDQTGNLLSDILVLAGLSNLSILHLEENHIRDLGPVVNLMSLTELNVLRNPLDDEACASHIPLILEHNPGIQIVYRPCGPLRLTLSSTAGGAVLTPGEGTFTYSYGQTVPLDARADPGFVFSHWSGTHYSTANPMSVTMDQDHEVRVQFLSLRDVLVVEGAAQGDPGPGDSTVSDPQEDGTPGHPFDSIQEAIDVADHGASVVVRPGTYREMIDLRGKGIRVTGLDPADPCSPYPVIHGNGQGPVVCWSRGEDSPCTLEGLVITGGRSEWAAAIHCLDSSPTFVRCLIVGNVATGSQGAVVLCRDSGATFSHCTIADNTPGLQGSVFSLAESPVTLANSIVWGNGSRAFLVYGAKGPAVAYTCVAGGWPGQGNLDTDPLFSTGGSWAPGLDGSGPVWIPGDYHLRSGAGRWDPEIRHWVLDAVTSPCIDAGDPGAWVGPEPAPHGDRVNLGAYGGTAQASRSPD